MKVLAYDKYDRIDFMKLLDIFILLFCFIIISKSIIRICGYIKAAKIADNNYLRFLEDANTKKNFCNYRKCAFIIWMIFIFVCFIFKFCFHFSPYWYIAGAYLLLIADVIFYSRYCLLNKIINYFTKANILCCFMCPIRGWDMAILASPAIFFISGTQPVCKIFIAGSLIISAVVFALWEKYKFHFISNSPNHNLCRRKCGAEYIFRHTCKRRYRRPPMSKH